MTFDVKRSAFPDGQPHVAVRASGNMKTIEARITSPDDLFEVLLTADALRNAGVKDVNLAISYLMGARMDRSMPTEEEGWVHPFTLKVVADVLFTGKWRHISVFDPHSSISTELLMANAVSPHKQVKASLALLPRDTVIVIPDAGAGPRVLEIMTKADLGNYETVRLTKVRDSNTGKLGGFAFTDPPGKTLRNRVCLIVDDLCDGGGTFVGAAKLLREAGVAHVHLYVSHGIFSKGYEIEGIDHIFTTDSYQNHDAPEHVTVFPWRCP